MNTEGTTVFNFTDPVKSTKFCNYNYENTIIINKRDFIMIKKGEIKNIELLEANAVAFIMCNKCIFYR